MASIYGDVLSAVKTIVSAMTGLTTANQVVIRKRLAFVKQTDAAILQAALPFICIAPTAEILMDGFMPNTDMFGYPVQVAIILESAFALANPEPILLLREQIRLKLRTTTLAGASEVFDVTAYNPSPPFSFEGFDAGVDVSVQEFTYETTEPRTA